MLRGRLGLLSSPGKRGISKAARAGSSTIKLSQGKAVGVAARPMSKFCAARGKLMSISQVQEGLNQEGCLELRSAHEPGARPPRASAQGA